ncbi:MAG: hypothetical protein SNJ77_03090, partial [Cytophagales bacterium]
MEVLKNDYIFGKLWKKNHIMKKFIALSLIIVTTSFVPLLTAQTLGDFRSRQTGNWNAFSTWQRFNGTVWQDAVSGQTPGVVAGANVLIRDGHDVTLNVTPTNSIGDLTIGEGLTGSLTTDNANRTLNVGGALLVNVGATYNINRTILTVSGATTISGTLSDASNDGSQTFNGTFTVNSGGSYSTVNTSVHRFGGNIVNNGTLNKTGTGAIIFQNAGVKTITGSQPITLAGDITINSDVEVVNNLAALLQINNNLNAQSATSIFTQGASSSTNYNGGNAPMNAGVFNANATGNTFRYTGNNDQSVRGATYNNLVISGNLTATRNKTANGPIIVNGFLTITNSGTNVNNFNIAGQDLTVNGNTFIESGGQLSDNNNAGINTFSGTLTINSGGTLTTGNTSAFVFGSDVLNNGTFTKSGTGSVTINGNRTFTNNNGTFVINGAVTTNNSLTLNGSNPFSSTGGEINVADNLNVNTNLTIGSGGLTVNGITNVNAVLSDNDNGGTNSFLGNLNINSGGTLTTGNTSPFVFGGNILNDGVFTKTGTGAITFVNPGVKTISGSQSFTISGIITINSGVEVINNLSALLQFNNSINGVDGTSVFTMGENTIVNYQPMTSPMSTVGVFNASAPGNTFRYSGNNDQNIKGTVYYNLELAGTLTGSRTKTLFGDVIVNNNYVAQGTGGNINILQLSTFSFTVNGTTDLLNAARITDNNALGTNLFIGKVTVSGNSDLNFSGGNSNVELRNGLEINSSVGQNFGSGTFRFTTNNQTISGSASFGTMQMFIDDITVINDVSHVNGLTVGVLNGSNANSVLVNKANRLIRVNNSTMPFAMAGSFDLTASGNIVEYNFNGNQNVFPTTYVNLTFSNNGTKFLTGNTTVTNNFTSNRPLDFGSAGVTLITQDVVSFTTTSGNVFMNGNATNNWLHSGENLTLNGLTTAVGNTIEFNRNGVQNIPSNVSWRNLVLSGSGNKNLTGATTILQNLTISGTATL